MNMAATPLVSLKLVRMATMWFTVSTRENCENSHTGANLTVQVKRGEIIVTGFGTKEDAHLGMHVTTSVWKYTCREQTRHTNSNAIELINVFFFWDSCVFFNFGICPECA